MSALLPFATCDGDTKPWVVAWVPPHLVDAAKEKSIKDGSTMNQLVSELGLAWMSPIQSVGVASFTFTDGRQLNVLPGENLSKPHDFSWRRRRGPNVVGPIQLRLESVTALHWKISSLYLIRVPSFPSCTWERTVYSTAELSAPWRDVESRTIRAKYNLGTREKRRAATACWISIEDFSAWKADSVCSATAFPAAVLK